MNPHKIKKIAIAGSGLAAVMTAVCLTKAMEGQEVDLVVIETPRPFNGEEWIATAPSFRTFHLALGIPEMQLAGMSLAVPYLGTHFRGWGRRGTQRDFVQAFGKGSEELNGLAFHQYVTWLAMQGHDVSVETFSIGAQLGRAGRFVMPRSGSESPFEYGLTISVPNYLDSMRRRLIEAGVHFVTCEQVHPHFSADGTIASVAVDQRPIEADFFIDASDTGVLARGDDPTGLFLDVVTIDGAAIASTSTSTPAIDALNRTTLLRSGHIQDVGTRTGRWLNFIHDSTQVSEDDLAAALPPGAEIHLRPIRQGRVEACWRGNCVAIGPAAGVLEPIGGFDVARIQAGLAQLLALFPDKRLFPSLARTYNRVVADTFDCQKDVVLALHAMSGRLQPSDWPESLRLRIEQFQSRGRVVLFPEDTFEQTDWASLLWGLGVIPERYDPLIDTFDPTKIMTHMRAAHRTVDVLVGQAPFVKQEAKL